MIFTLPQKTKTLWQIRTVVAITFLCLIIALFGRNYRWSVFLIVSMACIGAIVAFVYLPAYFSSYKIVVEDDFISVLKGVFIKNTNIMPYPRLVFAQSLSTPLASLFKMKIILLKAARGWLLIPEIEKIDAEFLLDHMRIAKDD